MLATNSEKEFPLDTFSMPNISMIIFILEASTSFETQKNEITPMLTKGYISRFINKAVKNNKINSDVRAITTTSFLESVSANLPPYIEPKGK